MITAEQKQAKIESLSKYTHANRVLWSDVEPYEIIRVVSDKCIEIRRMNAVRDESVVLEFSIGGFAAHCSNQDEQKWIYSSNVDAPVIRIRPNKTKGYGIQWKDKHGTRYSLNTEPHKFYDYNF